MSRIKLSKRRGGDESWTDSTIHEDSMSSEKANVSVSSVNFDGHQTVAARFKHLLEPIRDLALNWNVDIAQELESYLADLELISVSFDGGATHMNFAEAALLIQGSACVYSRKVEHLYKLVFRVLDVIADRQRNSKSDAADPRDADPEKMFPNEPEFIALDDIAEAKSSAIDLLEREDRSLATNLSLMRSPILLTMSLEADMEDTSDPNKDLRLASACVHSSGALLLDARFAGLLDRSCVDSLNSPWGAVECARACEQSPSICVVESTDATCHERPRSPNGFNMQGIPEFEAETGCGEDSDDDHTSVLDRDGLIPESEQNLESKHPSQAIKKQPSNIDHGVKDLWNLLDPHQSEGCKERPFRKGKTFRQPRSSRDTTVSKAWTQQSVRFHQSRSLKLPYFPDLSCIYLQERSRRLAQRLADARARAVAAASNGDMEDDYDEVDLASLDPAGGLDPLTGHQARADAFGFGVEQADLDCDDDDGEEAGTGSSCEGGLEQPDGLAAFESPSGRGSGRLGSRCEGEVALSELSYEEMCRQYVDKYLSGVETLLQQSGLAARVNEWQARLAPRLEEEESRRTFDMHEYGEEMMNRIQAVHEREQCLSDKPAQPVSFALAVRGLHVHDVCRSFLAALQLANDGNVEISLADSRDRQSVHLRLLSTHSRHRAMVSDYVAPSLLSARKKKRLKPPASPAAAVFDASTARFASAQAPASPGLGAPAALVLTSPYGSSQGAASQASQAPTQPCGLEASSHTGPARPDARPRKARPGQDKENQALQASW